MATKIRGITIELAGDTSKLESSLKGVNSAVKSTQGQLKDVQKLLKLDPTNIDLLRQKQELLADQVKNTTDKLDQLKAAQEQMDAEGVDKNSEAYMALQREIIDTEISLENLQKAAAQSNVALEQVGAVAGKVSEGANKVADSTKKISAAAAGVLAGLGGLAYSAIKGADDLNTLAKQTGFTTDELQKFQYASDLVDVSVSDITGAAAKLTKSMASGSDAFAQLGIQVTDTNGNMRDSTSVFYETLSALSQVSNETERDQLAMEIFGKSANELAGIIDDGGAALRAYGAEAEQLGLIMSGETLDGLNAVNDEVDKLKAKAKAQFAQTGAKALEAFLPVLERVMSAISNLLNWLGSLDSSTIGIISVILAVVAAISPVASIIGTIAGAVQTLIPIILAMNAAIAANPAVLVVAAIVAVVAAATALVIANWDTVKAAFIAVTNKIKSAAADAWEKIQSGVQTAAEVARNAFDSLQTMASSVANGISSLIERAINAVIGKLNALIGLINSVISAAAGLLGLGFGGIGTIGDVKLPRFAKGGSIGYGTALVGEAGPELLTVAGGRATVQPLTATLDGSSLAALGAGGSQQTNVNIRFSGSLAQLAAVLQPAITAETSRRGVSIIK